MPSPYMYRVPDNTSVTEWVRWLFATKHNARDFYRSKPWRIKRAAILQACHNECIDCKRKAPAVYSKATVVHHDRYLDKRPDLALSDTWTDGEGIEHDQLVPLCHECHDIRHGRFKGREATKRFTNEERW